MRTSIVLWQVFYCSIAYSEGGRAKFPDFSAYVIKVWPLSPFDVSLEGRKVRLYTLTVVSKCLQKSDKGQGVSVKT